MVVVADLLSVASAGPATGPADVGERFTGELLVRLEDALWRDGNADSRWPLTLRIDCDEGRWERDVAGVARRYNQADHWGRLVEVPTGGPGWRFRAAMHIEPDPYGGGAATAEYTVNLRREGGKLAGTWEGTFRGQACKGTVGGQVLPAGRADGWAPPKPGEHPRLLIRQGQVPDLRRKAETPWGRKVVERLKTTAGSKSETAVAQGLLYVLTGQKEYAEKVRELIGPEPRHWYTTGGVVHEGPVSAMETALAYDLVHGACDEEFRRRMVERFILFLPGFYCGMDQGQFNQNDVSNWNAMFRSGVGLCALATLDEPWLDLPAPARPVLARRQPPKDLPIGKGVPVVELASGASWPRWLFAGPFAVGPVGPVPHPGWTASRLTMPARAQPLEDALAAIGGEASARPEEGTKVGEVAFVPLDEKHLFVKDPAERAANPAEAGSIDMVSATRGRHLTTSCLYCVIDNAKAGYFRVELPVRKIDARVYIAGQPFRNGDVLHLEAGRYPVLARVMLTLAGSWMKSEFKLRLEAVTEEEAKAWLARQETIWQADLATWEDWKADKARPHRPGNFWSRHWLGAARERVAGYAARSIGEMGWNTEGEAYTQHASRAALAFCHAYRNAMGRELAPEGHYDTWVGGYLARTIAGQRVRMQSYGCGGGPMGVDNLARGFGLLAEELRPAAAWLWDRTQAAADGGGMKEPVAPIDKLDPVSAAFLFVNYPLEMKARDPSDLRARIVVDRNKGGYVFRDRWKDDDDFVAQVFANSEFAGGTWGTSEAGDLRISGLGVDWVVRGAGYGHTGSSRKAAHTRLYANVVLPSEPTAKGPMEAAATHYQAGSDGSGVVSLNMDNVYSGGEQPGPKGEVRAVPVRGGARAGYDLGIRGLRSFAADYSGASGAPALFVLADSLAGTGGKNTWQLVTDKAHKVSVSGNTFTIAADNGATLCGTVAAPAGVKIDAADVSLDHEINYHGRHANFSFPRTVLSFTGGEFFLVVMTVQRDAPPGVQVHGAGPAAKAVVGKRTVAFDGQKVVLGTK
jgi:hypothetical protein